MLPSKLKYLPKPKPSYVGELIKDACLPLPLKSYHVEPVPAYDDELFASR